jgi:hypothetical protein
MSWTRKIVSLMAGVVIAYLAWQWTTAAQTTSPRPGPSHAARVDPSRFEFEILESYDAKYLGDTPGHMGRYGGFGQARPNVALGDPVYREDTKVGTVTGLAWDRAKGSLQVEFDPEPFQRIVVGEVVWISLNSPNTPKSR